MRIARQTQLFLISILLVVATIVIMSGFYFATVIQPYRANIDLHIEGDWPIANDAKISFTAARNASTLRIQKKGNFRYNIYTDHRSARMNGPREKTGDQVKIMTIGGSFSWGQGFENEDTFTSLLGRIFDVPVVNLSMGSYGTVQSLQLLERHIDLKPKVIVYGFIADHPRRNLTPCAPTYAPFCLAVSYVASDDQAQPYIHAPHAQYFQSRTKQFLNQVVFDDFGLNDILWGARISFL